MPTQLIAPGITELSCAEFTVTPDAPVTVSLFDADGHEVHRDARALIQLKASNATWTTIAELTAKHLVDVIAAGGVWRVKRMAGPSFGVDRS